MNDQKIKRFGIVAAASVICLAAYAGYVVQANSTTGSVKIQKEKTPEQKAKTANALAALEEAEAKAAASTTLSPESEKLLAEGKAKSETDAARKTAEQEARGEWTYLNTTDDATGKKSKSASLKSKNTMNFGSPYGGAQHGRFTIRNHPRYGVDAYLTIQRGQLLCDDYSNTNVLVRFDDGPATAYSCAESADYSSDIVFIRNVTALESKIKTAQKMFITVGVYDEGQRTWEFNVKSYDQNKV